MRSKTFRRKSPSKHKGSRRIRGGQDRTKFVRSNTAELDAMEQGYSPTAPPMEQVVVPTNNQMNMLRRSNSNELLSMEEGNANPQVAIDVESTPDIEMGMVESGGRKRRTRKTRKTRKGKKSRKSSKRKSR